MSFVKVRHADGREADITKAEVAYYRSMGFNPVDGSVNDGSDPGERPPAANDPPAPTNGTDIRLDLVLDELRGLRSDLAAFRGQNAEEPTEPADGETVDLREPAQGEPADGVARMPETPNLDDIKRADLNAYAESVGVADAASYPNKEALIAAIEGGAARQ